MLPSFEGAHADVDPSLSPVPPKGKTRGRNHGSKNICELRKICAKLSSGVRFGVRFDLERSCGSECKDCGDSSAFRRECRHFTFRPHYDVALETKKSNPERKVSQDICTAHYWITEWARTGVDTRRFLQRLPVRLHPRVSILDVVCRALGGKR